MIRNLVFSLLYHLQISPLLQRINSSVGKFPILIFHRVSPNADHFWPPMSDQTFEETLILLKKHYTILPLERIFDYSDKELSRACFITFDDGFEDTFIWARPILMKHAAMASFFIPTGCLENREIIWQIQLRNSLFYSPLKSIDFSAEGLPLSFKLHTEEEKKHAFLALIDYMSKVDEDQFQKILALCFEKFGKYQDENISMMSNDQLKELAAAFGIHSHTRNHYFLSRLSSARISEEYRQSVDDLDKLLNPKKVFLAYPVGDYSKEALALAKKYFSAAFGVSNTLANSKKLANEDYRFEIPRFNIHQASAYEVYALVNGFHAFIRRMLSPFGVFRRLTMRERKI